MTTPTPLPRREFIKQTTGLLTGVLAAASGLAALFPSRAWAVDLGALSTAEGATLLAMCRTLFPHDGLDDAAYALVIGALDGDARKDPAQLALLKGGVASLDEDFTVAPEATRIAALKTIEGSPFFTAVRVRSLQVLYNNPIAFAHFGYEGEVFSRGGYLHRGFDDLRWLPDVPADDSGPIYNG